MTSRNEMADVAARPLPPATRLRKLWLCADDYGISPAVSRGIRDLIGRGRLNATSVMVGAPSFSPGEVQALVEVAGPPGDRTDAPSRRAAIGLHFTLTAPFRPATRGYRPTSPDGTFPSLPRSLAAGLLRRLDPAALAAEATSQLAAFRSAFGGPPDFVDGHQHVHLLPQVTDALLPAMRAAAPGAWIRQCGRAVPLRQRWGDPKGLLLDGLSARLRAHCAASGIRTNPAFAGTYDFRRAAHYDALFASFLQDLPDNGLVMCHPGFVDAELQRLDELTAMREAEHAFFASDRFLAMLAATGIVLA
jgi:chitin disaccharide deacetylase